MNTSSVSELQANTTGDICSEELVKIYRLEEVDEVCDYDFAALFDTKFDFVQWEKWLKILPNVFEERLKDPVAKALSDEVLLQRENMNVGKNEF